ncbi:hypothetical protein [Halomicrobium salinisoli]|uniref:hypothetical protein n=1 Tax=Halomicrobium salinisoli TaxID=2878391 RepID=UPI001CEFD9C7|nr:hypothetical protein [Halomicrobium salinisoli]
MDTREKVTLTGVIGLLGAVVFLALSVYPFQYGPVESGVLAGTFVAAALFQFVLGEATFGGEPS